MGTDIPNRKKTFAVDICQKKILPKRESVERQESFTFVWG